MHTTTLAPDTRCATSPASLAAASASCLPPPAAPPLLGGRADFCFAWEDGSGGLSLCSAAGRVRARAARTRTNGNEHQGSAGRRQTSRPPTRTSRPPRSASVPCCAPHGHVCRCSGHSDLHAAQRTSRRPAAPSPSSHDGGKAGPGPGERTAPLMVGPGGRDVTLVRTRVSTANSGTIPRHSGILRPLSGANSF